ncbi:Cupin 2 conserved barrel domain protein [Marinithermus hydrothermalis DSM 14884]|uniref:Cupin 2 conserved barrel domain protein n=2 Tax=Marinithermus TaxID=186191 RepID=F2NL92_MARHT|nr:Cupin 2 conserved barrel domain protein [Marinithermus hydrothermalis DSM 14884]
MGFPEWFKGFHRVDAWPGLKAAVISGKGGQVGFFECTEEIEVPEHAHEGQWGIVVEGVVELTIGGVHHVLRKGDSYHIPAGVPHAAKLHKGCAFIDVWEGVRFPELTEASP